MLRPRGTCVEDEHQGAPPLSQQPPDLHGHSRRQEGPLPGLDAERGEQPVLIGRLHGGNLAGVAASDPPRKQKGRDERAYLQHEEAGHPNPIEALLRLGGVPGARHDKQGGYGTRPQCYGILQQEWG